MYLKTEEELISDLSYFWVYFKGVEKPVAVAPLSAWHSWHDPNLYLDESTTTPLTPETYANKLFGREVDFVRTSIAESSLVNFEGKTSAEIVELDRVAIRRKAQAELDAERALKRDSDSIALMKKEIEAEEALAKKKTNTSTPTEIIS